MSDPKDDTITSMASEILRLRAQVAALLKVKEAAALQYLSGQVVKGLIETQSAVDDYAVWEKTNADK